MIKLKEWRSTRWEELEMEYKRAGEWGVAIPLSPLPTMTERWWSLDTVSPSLHLSIANWSTVTVYCPLHSPRSLAHSPLINSVIFFHVSDRRKSIQMLIEEDGKNRGKKKKQNETERERLKGVAKEALSTVSLESERVWNRDEDTHETERQWGRREEQRKKEQLITREYHHLSVTEKTQRQD